MSHQIANSTTLCFVIARSACDEAIQGRSTAGDPLDRHAASAARDDVGYSLRRLVSVASIARLLLASGMLLSPAARAEEPASFQLTIRDHRFSPAEITVPSGKPVFLEITNQDAEPEEFEMRQLAIEKVIVGAGHARVRLRPLGPGRYNFIGEYHSDTAQGSVVAQ